ncbi:MAG TPA: ABC transporter ATP-binding protein [Amycolatopsis sp.]|nr:ABC transporter ATP-binding protein [Amycolatopsis sp.]
MSVRGLSVRYSGRTGAVLALDGANLVVRRGETVAVVGASGSGKSTLARAVVGLLPPSASVLEGEIVFGGQSLLGLPDRDLRAIRGRGIAVIPADPAASLNPVVPIGVQVAETLRVHGLARGRAAGRAAVDLLRTAGLPEPEVIARCHPHQLSGGMRQRALIAIALAGRPELIIADEPTSALDVTVQARILDHLSALSRRSGTAVVLITHDLGVAADRAGRIVVLDEGRTVEDGPAAAVVTRPRDSRTRALLAGAAGPAPARPRPVHRGEPLVVAENLTKVFTGPHRRAVVAVDGVGFTIARGETLALVGESAAGKSTVARLVVRSLVPDGGGRILFDGQDIAAVRKAELRRFRRRVQLIFQDPRTCLDPRFCAADLIEEPLRAFGLGEKPARHARVATLADLVALPRSLLARRPGELSSGECQRVAIARALAPGPDLLVCDEPASSLDVRTQAQVLGLLTGLQDELGLSCLFIAHDLAVARRIAHRVVVLRHGRIIEEGAAAEIFRSPTDPYTRTLLAAIPGSGRRPSLK